VAGLSPFVVYGREVRKIMDRVQQIIQLEADYDKLSAEAEANRWETARLYAEELAAGKSQRGLAREVGKSEGHIRRMRKCWEIGRVLKDADMPKFNTAYNSTEIRGEPKPRPEPEDSGAHDWAVRARASVGRALGRAAEVNGADCRQLAGILEMITEFLDE